MARRKSSLDNKLKHQKMQYASNLFLSDVYIAAKEAVEQRERESLIKKRAVVIGKLKISEGSMITLPFGNSSRVSRILPDLLLRLENWDEIDPCNLLK
jgi:hypothetical protein